MSLNSVVKFFIFLIVIVFDPLAIALVIAFNQLVLGQNKKEEVINKEKTKEIIEEETRLKLSEEDLRMLESVLLTPPSPNDNLKEAVKTYNEQVEKKQPFDEMLIKTELTQEERHDILVEMMKNDEELGLYDEPIIEKDEIDLKEIADKLQDRELFPESNQRAKEIIENSNWDITLMDGLEDEEPFFTEEEVENILQEEPTEEEIQRNFSTIEPNTENIFQEEDYVGQFNDWENETPEQFDIPVDEIIQEFNQQTIEEEFEDNRRMDIIGQNGNEGLHYENEENTSSEQDDEKKN